MGLGSGIRTLLDPGSGKEKFDQQTVGAHRLCVRKSPIYIALESGNGKYDESKDDGE
jgi:hypothetical protein